MHTISVVSDIVCPWCYIGKHRLANAIEILAEETPAIHSMITVEWLPFELNPGLPVSGMDRGDYCRNKFGSLEHANKLYENVAANARADGLMINLDKITVTPNTKLAHKLIALSAEHNAQSTLIDKLFSAYFVDGKNVGDPEVLTALAIEVGLNQDSVIDVLSDAREAPNFEALVEQAYDSGAQGVPAFLWNQQWLFTGAQSPETIAMLIKKQISSSN